MERVNLSTIPVWHSSNAVADVVSVVTALLLTILNANASCYGRTSDWRVSRVAAPPRISLPFLLPDAFCPHPSRQLPNLASF